MSQMFPNHIYDEQLFEKTNTLALDLGILLGRICQQEPNGESIKALYTVSSNILSMLNSDQIAFSRKQKAYPQKTNEAILFFLDAYKSLPHLELIETARSDYMRLLVGIGDPLAAPWESVYQSSERSIFQASTLDVRRWFHNYGIRYEHEYTEPDDHIGVMLEFICHVLKNHIQSATPRDEHERPVAIAEFIQEHFLSWAEQWNDCIQQYAHTSYYKALGWEIILISVYLEQLIQN